MKTRTKVIITISAVILILIIVMLIAIFSRPDNEPIIVDTQQNNSEFPSAKIPVSSSLTSGASQKVIAVEPKTEASLKAVAITFAERFGSYSSESGYVNLQDLQTLMTVKMKAWANSYKTEQESQSGQNQVFYGISTSALTAKITSLDEGVGRAEVAVSTQREESKGSTINPRTFYQEIILKLVNTDDSWRIDEASWK